MSAISPPRLRQIPYRRLPRFIRAKRSHRPPLVLQDRDLDILRTVYEYRLISTPQILFLFKDESRDGIYRRLQRLFHHGYVDRLGENPNAPLVYALGRRGASVLDVVYRKEVGERYVAHQLMVSEFRAQLDAACRPAGVGLSWRRLPEGTPVRPDGFFSLVFPHLPEGRNRAFFFLEADRSTMPGERFFEKLRRYWRWFATGGHTAALGIKRFRVLVVTRSEERVTSLTRGMERQPDLRDVSPMVWFTRESRFVAAGGGAVLSAPIWVIPTDRAARNLLP